MKKASKRVIAIVAVLVMVITCISAVAGVALADNSKSVDIVFTSDMHSNLNSFTTKYHDETGVNIGGFARVTTIINEAKAENPNTLVIDGGDFSMGTLFHTLFETEAAELRLMGQMGIDVTTFGNHEFNFGSEGLRNMLKAAMNSGEKLPQIVECNINWSDPGDEQETKDVFDQYGVKDYTMIKKGDTNIAVVGVFGENALACEPTCTLDFEVGEAGRQHVKSVVEDIKANEDADMIVCVSHSGLDGDVGSGKTEDELLAKEVPDIDVILSGHSHTELSEPLQVGDTYILGVGEYTESVGLCSLYQESNGRWSMDNYELKQTYDTVASDPTIQARIDEFAKKIDEQYLAQFGLTKTQVLAQSDFDFAGTDAIVSEHDGQNLGDLMSDAYLYAARQADPDTEFDISVVPSGTIRGTYTKGDITTDDVFNSFSLGIGPDKVPGYPLIKVYLTGKELKTAAEIDATISYLFAGTRLYFSGLDFTFNTHRLPLNRVESVQFEDQKGDTSELEDDKLYCVVADLYSGQMLGSVSDASYGILTLVPKDKDGNEITDFNEAIIYDANGKEVKAWDGIAQYMQSFDKNESGISQVPGKYSESQGRKINDTSWNPIKLISHPNVFFFAIVGIVIVVIAIIVLIIMLIVYIIKRIYYGKNYKRIKEAKKEEKRQKKYQKQVAKAKKK